MARASDLALSSRPPAQPEEQHADHAHERTRCKGERPMDADCASEQADGEARARAHAHRSHVEQADDPPPHIGWGIQLHERLRHRVE